MNKSVSNLVISVVSHCHGSQLASTLDDLVAHAPPDATLVVTLNVPEDADFDRERWPNRVVWRDNAQPKGFGANHNAALKDFNATWYGIVNPDIQLYANVFQSLIAIAQSDDGIGMITPAVVDSFNVVQDSARALPTPYRVLDRAVGRWSGRQLPPEPESEWHGGMFMVVQGMAFRAIGGFDERYFMYCEDTDLCARLRLAGFRLLHHPEISVVHDAQRNSQKSIRHLRWHMESLARLWLSQSFWRYRQLLASERTLRAIELSSGAKDVTIERRSRRA